MRYFELSGLFQTFPKKEDAMGMYWWRRSAYSVVVLCGVWILSFVAGAKAVLASFNSASRLCSRSRLLVRSDTVFRI